MYELHIAQTVSAFQNSLILGSMFQMAELKPRLERLFAAWRPGVVQRKNFAAVSPSARPQVYLLDKPGSEQTVVIAGNPAPPKSNPDEPAIETMNAVLGSDFGSRLNMNLREDKHWSYGAGSFIRDARGPRPFIAYAPVSGRGDHWTGAATLVKADTRLRPETLGRWGTSRRSSSVGTTSNALTTPPSPRAIPSPVK